jgi:hypothetical protein
MRESGNPEKIRAKTKLRELNEYANRRVAGGIPKEYHVRKSSNRCQRIPAHEKYPVQSGGFRL